MADAGEAYVLGLDPSVIAAVEAFLDTELARISPRISTPAPAKMPPPPSLGATHPEFGVGKVVGDEGTGDQRKLTIEFDAVGRRVVLARFVELSER